ncbi:MAG: caspase family protein [Pseudomonadota bacterium]
MLIPSALLLFLTKVRSLRSKKVSLEVPAARWCFVAIASVAVLVSSPPSAFAQFNTNRAVQRAITTNVRSALERVQLSLKVKESAGSVVVQKTSRNGRYLLLVFEDNRPRVWDLDKSRYWDHFQASGESVIAAAIASDMSFVTLHSDGSLARWSPEAKLPVSQSSTQLTGARFLELDRTGDVIVLAEDGALYAFSESLERLGQASAAQSTSRTAMAMDPSGDVVVTAVAESSLRLWSSRTGAPIGEVNLDRDITAFAFGNESSRLLIAIEGAVVDWDVRRSSAVGEFPCPSNCTLEKLLVNSATQSLIAVAEDGNLLRWSLGRYESTGVRVVYDQNFAALTTAAGAPLLIGGTTRGLVHFSHLEKPDTQLTLVSTRRGWAMIDALGRFDGQVGEDNGVSWANDDLEFPLPSFVDTHFEPGLFSKWLYSSFDYLTDPRALAEGVLTPPRIEMSLEAPGAADPDQLITVEVVVTDDGGGLGTPTLYHLGLKVSPEKVVSSSTKEEGDRRISTTVWRVRALPGENTFTAKVKDQEGVISPARVDSVQISGDGDDPALHLLAIAVDDYGDEQLNLNYSTADAEAVVANLRDLAGPLFSQVYTTTITNEDATREGVLAAVRGMRDANPEDVIVIYAASHGEVFDDNFHLLLQGLRLPLSKRRVKQVGLAFDELARELELLDARRVVMLLDTCKSGDALENLQSDFRDRRALQSFGNLLGLHLIAATAKGQLATESSVLGHGVFTYNFIQGLQGNADRAPQDGVLTASEIAEFAEAGVPALSAQYAAFPQWPTVYARGFDFGVAASALTVPPGQP